MISVDDVEMHVFEHSGGDIELATQVGDVLRWCIGEMAAACATILGIPAEDLIGGVETTMLRALTSDRPY